MRRFGIALALALILAGCGGGSDDVAGPEGSATAPEEVSRTITIRETDFALDPKAIRVKGAGRYVLEVVNDGQTAHALEVEGQEVHAETEEIAPGERARLELVVTDEGAYRIYCPVGDHAGRGMEGTFVVGRPGAGSTQKTTTGTGRDY